MESCASILTLKFGRTGKVEMSALRAGRPSSPNKSLRTRTRGCVDPTGTECRQKE